MKQMLYTLFICIQAVVLAQTSQQEEKKGRSLGWSLSHNEIEKCTAPQPKDSAKGSSKQPSCTCQNEEPKQNSNR